MPLFKDQTGRIISIDKVPRRIISLVPSQTELLFNLGLDKEVVGITKFCVHPAEWFRSKKKVGGTKQLVVDIIHQLYPDLIIANKEENVKEQIEDLQKHYPVWISDVNNLDDAYNMIEHIGLITDKINKSKEIIGSIKKEFSRLQPITSPLGAGGTAYLIWQNPYMAAGGDTFIHSMLTAAGFENIFAHKKRYPEIKIDELQAANCQLVLLSSEPFPFSAKHKEELQRKLPGTQVILVDGEMFSWYGSRLLIAPAYFNQLHQQI